MSEPGPDSVPTSADPRSHRPTKKRALTPLSQHASQVDALFAQPDKQITLAPSSRTDSTNGSGTVSSRLAPPPDIVTNVQGSSAGAGSGEFHVYKASRRREYERIRMMEEETAREEADREWATKQKETRAKVEAKASKNKAKRDKAKARKEAAKSNGLKPKDNEEDEEGQGEGGGVKKKEGATNGHAQKVVKKLGPHKTAAATQENGNDGGGDNTNVESVEEFRTIIHDDD